MVSSLTGNADRSLQRDLNSREKMRLLGSLVLLALLLTIALVMQGPSAALVLQVGDISPRDVVASRAVTYNSEVLTERARQVAESQVGIIYDAPDPSVARQQVNHARQLLDKLTAARENADTVPESIQELDGVSISNKSAKDILAFSNSEWLVTESEVVRVLEESMRSVIRDVDISAIRQRMPALVGYELTTTQSAVVVDIAGDLIVPNSIPNDKRTADERLKAREAVQPVSVTWLPGQVIVRAGDRVTELQLEALERIGISERAPDWQENAATAIAILLVMLVIYLYIAISEPDLGRDWRRLGMFALSCFVFALVARLMMPGHVVLPYIYPAAALPMLVAVLVSRGMAPLAALLPACFYTRLASGSLLELATYGLIGGIAGVLMLGRLRQLKTFAWAGALVIITNAVSLVLYDFPSNAYDAIGFASLLGAAVVSGGLSASIVTVVYLLVGGSLGAVTSLQLFDLARPTNPLLRDLLLKAPGTYHHSILVANMAEQAAERVGGNALLARVGAYYHDIGKISRPYFFSENQTDGTNVHERLDPLNSAEIIISHVQDGVELGKRKRLPSAVIAFIAEHHGKMRQDYFYADAVKRYGAEAVDESAFCYPGPRPLSKETGIVMLADACEAAVRAVKPSSAQDLAQLIERIVDDRILEGELDECALTMHDIAATKIAFVNVLQGVFHPRVQYPQGTLVQQRPPATPISSAKSAELVESGETKVLAASSVDDTVYMPDIEQETKPTENDIESKTSDYEG